LIILRRSGFIRSARGRRGGHQLARSPQKIRLSDAVRALDGTTAPIDCIEAQSCGDDCPYCNVWQEIKQATDAILKGKTLADITARAR
jgi:Rrf2 family protein